MNEIYLWKTSARDEGSDAADKAVEAVKQGVNATVQGGQELKDKAASTAEDVSSYQTLGMTIIPFFLVIHVIIWDKDKRVEDEFRYFF